MLQVMLYTKPECPLCDEARHLLNSLQSEFPLVLLERNILDDPQDFARFRYLIPVIDIAGGALLYPPHDWLTLGRALQSAGSAETHAA